VAEQPKGEGQTADKGCWQRNDESAVVIAPLARAISRSKKPKIQPVRSAIVGTSLAD